MKSLPTSEINANQLFKVFERSVHASVVRTLAKKTRFVVRSRKMEPFILFRALVDVFSSDKEFTLSSIYDRYIDLCIEQGLEYMKWEPFYDFLAKKEFLHFVKDLYSEVNREALKGEFSEGAELVKVLSEKFERLEGIELQDGSEIATNCKHYSGKITPQIKLHATLDVKSGAMHGSSVTKGIKSERDCISVTKLAYRLLIADAGYQSLKLFAQIARYKGLFLVKLTTNSALTVLEAYKTDKNGEIEKQEIITKDKTHPKGDNLKSSKFCDGLTHDSKVTTSNIKTEDGKKFEFRVVKFYLDENIANDKELTTGIDEFLYRGKMVRKRFVLLATNIPSEVLDAEQIAQLYRARWSVEIAFRMHKGFCGLKKTLTKSKTLSKALVVMSQIVYSLKLLLAQGMEKIVGKTLSPKKTAHYGTRPLNVLLSLLGSRRKCVNSIKLWSEKFSRMEKSRPSYINRIKGKGLSCVIECLRKEPKKLKGKSTDISTNYAS